MHPEESAVETKCAMVLSHGLEVVPTTPTTAMVTRSMRRRLLLSWPSSWACKKVSLRWLAWEANVGDADAQRLTGSDLCRKCSATLAIEAVDKR